MSDLEARLLECEEALRCTQAEFESFRIRTLGPITARHESIETMCWDDLLGVAVRNLNLALDRDAELAKVIAQRDAALAALKETDSWAWNEVVHGRYGPTDQEETP